MKDLNLYFRKCTAVLVRAVCPDATCLTAHDHMSHGKSLYGTLLTRVFSNATYSHYYHVFSLMPRVHVTFTLLSRIEDSTTCSRYYHVFTCSRSRHYHVLTLPLCSRYYHVFTLPSRVHITITCSRYHHVSTLLSRVHITITCSLY